MNDNEKYIEEFVKDVPFDAPEGGHRDALKKQLLSAYPKHRLQPTAHTVGVWRIIMNKRIIKLAAAAVIIIAVLVVINNIDSSSVALAGVLEKVEGAHAFMYRMKMQVTGEMMPGTPALDMEQEATIIISTDLGMKMEMTTTDPNSGKQTIQQMYVLPEEKAMVMIMPEQKKYVRWDFNDELLARMKKQSNDPREMIKKILNYEYTKLGRSVIDGVTVEGFETTDPAVYGGVMGGSIKISLWVDVVTWLPVLTEMDIEMGEQMRIQGVIYDYQWDIQVDEAEFEPVIPEDFEPFPAGGMKMPEMSEEAAVEGLKFFVEMSGQYPKKLNLMNLMQEFSAIEKKPTDAALKVKEEMNRITKDEQMKKTMEMMRPVQSLGMFYMMLVQDRKDPAYYGDKVTAEFPHAVLMRWKAEGGNYRVIFGDLTIEDVTADELAELEAAPLNIKPTAIKPQPADGASAAVFAEVELSWMPGAYVNEHKVYFGTEADELSLLAEVTDSCSVMAPALERTTTYYWCVDEVQPDGSVAAGDVWSFNTGELVGWWKLDDGSGNTATDSSGNGLDGTLVGDTSWVDGIVAGALVFDGDGDYVDVGRDPAFDITQQITVSAWIKVNAFDREWQAIVTKGDSAWRLQRNWKDNTLEFACTGLVVPGNKWGSIHCAVDVNDGRWHHAAGTYNGSQICLYVDGKLDVSSTASGTIKNNGQPVYIGVNSERPYRFWNGLIDDVRLYSYALSADEVASIYATRNEEK